MTKESIIQKYRTLRGVMKEAKDNNCIIVKQTELDCSVLNSEKNELFSFSLKELRG